MIVFYRLNGQLVFVYVQNHYGQEMLSIVDEAESSNPSTASVLLHMGDLNGRQKAVDYFLSLPDVFLNIIEEMKENKDNKTD